MKITAFNGSPRGPHGNTSIMVESFLAGAKAAGAETEHILLVDKNIHPCRGCFACWLKTPGRCILNDDMTEILKKFIASDIVVFATPLYIFNVTGIMKNFMDRLIPLGDPHFELDEDGMCRHVNKRGTFFKFVIISNCGFPEHHHFKALHDLFKTCAYHFHAKILAEIYRGEGEILSKPPFLLKPIIYHYKKLLKEAGKQIIKNSELTADLVEKLNKPLIPPPMYIKEANKYFDKILRQNM